MKYFIRYLERPIIAILIAIMAVGCSLPTTNKKIGLSQGYSGSVIPPSVDHELITNDGQVAEPLLVLLDLLNVKHEGTVESVNVAMQENFSRKPSVERRNMKDPELDQTVTTKAIALIEELGLLQPIPRFQVDADYFL